ncbi:MAG: aldehyde dehydrogenase family protein [Gaiellales bacterium]
MGGTTATGLERPLSVAEIVAGDARQLVGGDWLDTQTRIDNLDPGNGELIGTVPRGSEEDVSAAVASAVAAAPAWAALSPVARGAVLQRAAGILEPDLESWAVLVTREMGKPLLESRAEVRRTLRILHYYAGEAERATGEHFPSENPNMWVFTRREPVGVVGVITPWNFPAAIPAWKVAPALVFGNAVVVKLADDAPLSGLVLVRALQEAGLPPGVLNAVFGDGEIVGSAIVRHPEVRAITFTGSTRVGLQVLGEAATRQKKIQLELGGHNPVIVCEDAHLPSAVDAVFQGAFASTGQKCTATRRVYVQTSVAKPFLRALLERTRSARVGYGLDPGVEVGPLVNERQLTAVLTEVERAAALGTLHIGGSRLSDPAYPAGLFVEPAIFTDLPATSTLACDEVFGPALGVWEYEGFDDAVAAANTTRYGLSAAVFTRDLDRAKAFTERIKTGVVRINTQTAGIEPQVPLTGWRDSGYGQPEQGRAAIDFFTDLKTVYLNPSE